MTCRTVSARATAGMCCLPVDFGEFVRHRGGSGVPVVQPRMGFSDPARMRAGLIATRRADAVSVGTITVDSYTRVGDSDAVRTALRDGACLNGYPIADHPADTTRQVLTGALGPDFPVQVRHGSASPGRIVRTLVALGLNATEGGPVSYCLPYGRTPLTESVGNWTRACEEFTGLLDLGIEPHLETFGGCMMGQLCPPGQLVAISVLEALFFDQHGLRSLSLSYAQQTSAEQDREAVAALRRLCSELLPTDNWHVVVYAYMGLFPQTPHGARRLLATAAELAASTGAERLIVKTADEAHGIPTIAENVSALEGAARATALHHSGGVKVPTPPDTGIYDEARALVHAVLNLDDDIGAALVTAFRCGYLDIPYCIHPDNLGRTRSHIDAEGRLRWTDSGSLPLPRRVKAGPGRRITSSGLLADLSYVRRKFDAAPVPGDE
ncbi:methylaspartate mutase [Streptomyces chlorus]